MEGCDGGLVMFSSLEGTLALEEDEDNFRVMLTIEDCAYFDGSLVKVGKGGSLVEGGEGGLGVFGSLEGTLAFEEDEDDFRVMLTLEDCAFFMVRWWR